MLHMREPVKLGPPDSCTGLLPSEPTLIKNASYCIPVQWELHSYILVCIFTNQSEYIHNNQ